MSLNSCTVSPNNRNLMDFRFEDWWYEAKAHAGQFFCRWKGRSLEMQLWEGFRFQRSELYCVPIVMAALV